MLRYKIASKYPLSGPFHHSGVGRNPEVAGPVRSYNLVLHTPVRGPRGKKWAPDRWRISPLPASPAPSETPRPPQASGNCWILCAWCFAHSCLSPPGQTMPENSRFTMTDTAIPWRLPLRESALFQHGLAIGLHSEGACPWNPWRLRRRLRQREFLRHPGGLAILPRGVVGRRPRP